MSIGIDYGLGQTNIDKATGIRYGVISRQIVGTKYRKPNTVSRHAQNAVMMLSPSPLTVSN
jgi:hypothetical protein